jgi:hypothetical protein
MSLAIGPATSCGSHAICATASARAYAAEELVAELCSAFLCAEFSIDGDLRHAGYIENWIGLLKGRHSRFLYGMQQGVQGRGLFARLGSCRNDGTRGMTMFSDRRHPKYDPLFYLDPLTGVTIEIFYADRTLESFGRRGAGFFWSPRRRGFAPTGPAHGSFPTSYSAYWDALKSGEPDCSFRQAKGC